MNQTLHQVAPMGQQNFSPVTTGDLIRRARLAAQLTHAEIGRLVGASESAVSHWENDKRSPNSINIRALARALSVNVESLIVDQAPQHALTQPDAAELARLWSIMGTNDRATLMTVARSLAENKQQS